ILFIASSIEVVCAPFVRLLNTKKALLSSTVRFAGGHFAPEAVFFIENIAQRGYILLTQV
ncbi:MAG TPA: hypothetical protein PKH23_06440, partial [Bacillota bacterium]|nr:hypothetical protein [Bacillota bacterium]